MKWWKRKKKRQPQVGAAFRRMANAAFPGGDDQIAQEAAEVTVLLQGRVSQARAREILGLAKGRILIALRSATDDAEAVRRCIDSILTRWPELDQVAAEEVATYTYRRMVEQSVASLPNATKTWTEMSKEEALVVARITVYRLARHHGRTDPGSRHAYDFDPRLYIMEYMAHLFKSLIQSLQSLEGRPKKIETRRDALQLSLYAAHTLALTHYDQEHGAETTLPAPEEVERLAHEELDLTLSLVQDADGLATYSDYDVSEARAAHEQQVPFDIALHLGEVGLLKDPPGPTDTRRKSVSDALRRLQDV